MCYKPVIYLSHYAGCYNLLSLSLILCRVLQPVLSLSLTLSLSHIMQGVTTCYLSLSVSHYAGCYNLLSLSHTLCRVLQTSSLSLTLFKQEMKNLYLYGKSDSQLRVCSIKMKINHETSQSRMRCNFFLVAQEVSWSGYLLILATPTRHSKGAPLCR